MFPFLWLVSQKLGDWAREQGSWGAERGRESRQIYSGEEKSWIGWKIRSVIVLSNFLNYLNILEFYFSKILKYCFTCHTILQAQKFSFFSHVTTLCYHISYCQNRTFCMLNSKIFRRAPPPPSPRQGTPPLDLAGGCTPRPLPQLPRSRATRNQLASLASRFGNNWNTFTTGLMTQKGCCNPLLQRVVKTLGCRTDSLKEIIQWNYAMKQRLFIICNVQSNNII